MVEMPAILPELFDDSDFEQEQLRKTTLLWQEWTRIDMIACRKDAHEVASLKCLTEGKLQKTLDDWYNQFSDLYSFDRQNADNTVKINANWYIHIYVTHLVQILKHSRVGSLKPFTQQGFESHNSLYVNIPTTGLPSCLSL
jgi:hypothetical protein